jgi:hypothetical protein
VQKRPPYRAELLPPNALRKYVPPNSPLIGRFAAGTSQAYGHVHMVTATYTHKDQLTGICESCEQEHTNPPHTQTHTVHLKRVQTGVVPDKHKHLNAERHRLFPLSNACAHVAVVPLATNFGSGPVNRHVDGMFVCMCVFVCVCVCLGGTSEEVVYKPKKLVLVRAVRLCQLDLDSPQHGCTSR